jgi:predicted transcriptional regulator
MSLLAEVIKQRRAMRESQGEVGLEIGKSQFYVSLVERGQMVADDAMLRRMMAAIDRIVERRKVISEATARAVTDFENRKLPADTGR